MTGYGFVDRRRDMDIHVMKLAPNGRVLYDRRVGGAGADRGVQSAVLADGTAVIVGYTKVRADAEDGEPVWQTIVHALDPRGTPTWTLPIGGLGRESGRWIAGTAADLWVVGQSATGTNGSAVLVARLGLGSR
jgi:hypothetical protein